MNDKQITNEREWRTPPCDIMETPDSYQVVLDMPGVDDRHLEITFQNGSLLISGKVARPARSGVRPARAEYAPYDFRREFSLSEQNIDVEKISAELKNGELLLTLPKSEKVRPRKIEVKTM